MTLQVMTRDQVIAALEQLPPEQWAEVVEFIRFLRFKASPTRPRGATLQRALGLLATNQPAPADAEVRQWLEEHRLRKYA